MFLIQHLSPILLLDKGHLQIGHMISEESETGNLHMFTTVFITCNSPTGETQYSGTQIGQQSVMWTSATIS